MLDIAQLLFKNCKNINEFDGYASPLEIMRIYDGEVFNDPFNQEYRSAKVCTSIESSTLFEFILGRKGGEERFGRTVESIFQELITSQEFSIKFDNQLWIHYQDNELELIIGAQGSKFKTLRSNVPIKINFVDSHTHFFENYETAIVDLDQIPIITLEKISLSRYIGRLQGFITILSEVIFRFPKLLGTGKKLLFAYGDNSCYERSVCFCSNKNDDYLIPDFEFVNEYGYHDLHSKYCESKKWADRLDKAYWRGADTSTRNYKVIENSPRIRLSLLSNQYISYIDAGIVSIENTKNFDIKKQKYDSLGIYKSPEAQETILNYRYQIDIDGNTNAWKGFYVKLLSGSPVLKIDSEFNFKQWYYHRLIPWVHYVPVKYDCSDLIEKIDFLRNNPLLAEYIGQQGQKFALNMTYEDELNTAVGVLIKAFNNI